MNSKPDVPAVVVGGTLNSLGVIRSLSVAQMPIYLVSTSRNCAAGWSRFCHFVQVPSLEGRSLIDSLKVLGNRLGNRPVLILTADDCVNAVSEHIEEVEGLYRISVPCPKTVRDLSDKVLFHRLAEQEDFAVPRSVSLESSNDLRFLDRLAPPLIIKPADKTLVLNDRVERAVRVNTVDEARNVASHMLEHAPKLIAQEWIDGPDDALFFVLFSCDRDSNLTGIFFGRKLVCDPPAIGNTAVCVEAAEVADELRKLALQFISRARYRGLGSLEFKRDSRTGRFIIVEPTVGRTDRQEEIATFCGVNLPLITYWVELGQAAPTNGAHKGPVAWRSTFADRIPPGTLPRGTRVVDGFFRWADPLPAFYYYGLERFAFRIARRVERLYRSRN